MKFSVLKLGTECRDKATGLDGTVTHWTCDMGQKISYLFQPRQLNDEGLPVHKLYLCEERLVVTEKDFEQVEVPFEILGTQVADKASGFVGMAVEFIRHINGCFHVAIQPSGIVAPKNTPVKVCDFDLRGCVGEKIPVLEGQELENSRRDRPSPTGDSFHRELPRSETHRSR